MIFSMGELIVQKHNFEASLQKLHSLSQHIPNDCTLAKVEEDGGFLGLGDHKVTGKELNSLTGRIQNKLISINGTLRNFYKEFNAVYETLDTLDKEYIAGILMSVSNSQKASDEALAAHKDISKTINALERTVISLKEFKHNISTDISAICTKLDLVPGTFNGCVHLKDIDTIWSDVKNLQSSAEKSCNNIITLKQHLALLLEYKQHLESLRYLNEIDSIWSDVKNLQSTAEKSNNDIIALKQHLTLLLDYKQYLESLQHLNEIDSMWSDIALLASRLDGVEGEVRQLNECVDKLKRSIDLYVYDFQKQCSEIRNSIDELIATINTRNIIVDKRIKILYWLSVSCIVLIITNFILQITGAL